MNALITVLILIGLVLAFVFGIWFPIYNEGIGMEGTLVAQYQANQVDKSAFDLAYTEQWGAIDATFVGLKDFMFDSVRGRYDRPGADGLPSGTINTALLINAIHENYPQTVGLTDLTNKFVSWIQDQRTKFANNQKVLVDKTRVYENWMTLQPKATIVSLQGFPSRRLEARIGTKVVYGREALEQMKLLVLYSDTKKQFETGEEAPRQLPTRQVVPATPGK